MLRMVELLFGWLSSLLKSRRRLQAENLVLRHQVNILRRRPPGRTRLSNPDRLVFVWLYRLCPSVAAVPLEMRFQGQPLSSGTTFVWRREGRAYLITNWHNATGINPTT